MFIDGNNFYHGLKSVGLSTQIDFKKFLYKLTQGYQLIRTYYYNSLYHQEKDPQKYHNVKKIVDFLIQHRISLLKLTPCI